MTRDDVSDSAADVSSPRTKAGRAALRRWGHLSHSGMAPHIEIWQDLCRDVLAIEAEARLIGDAEGRAALIGNAVEAASLNTSASRSHQSWCVFGRGAPGYSVTECNCGALAPTASRHESQSDSSPEVVEALADAYHKVSYGHEVKGHDAYLSCPCFGFAQQLAAALPAQREPTTSVCGGWTGTEGFPCNLPKGHDGFHSVAYVGETAEAHREPARAADAARHTMPELDVERLREMAGWTTRYGWCEETCASIRYPGSPSEPHDPCTCGGDRLATIAAAYARDSQARPVGEDLDATREPAPAVDSRSPLEVQEDDMCPNCVTPWKCNGPHLSPRS